MSLPVFSLIVPTLNAELTASNFMVALQSQTVKPKYLQVFDSTSRDNTAKIFSEFGADVFSIAPLDFDHGTTRQVALNAIADDVELLVYMTQDSILADPKGLENLIKVFADKTVGAAYGRQLPNLDADPIEAYARFFNYPSESLLKSLADSKILGIKTCFMSNSFAAYRISALKEVGGFPENNIVSEETYVAAKMLEAGWKIKYCADAKVYHSHNYSILKDVQRYFDLGVFHSREPWVRQRFGQAEGEGRRFVLSELAYLWRENYLLIPSALLRTLAKYLGFKLGFCEACLPKKIKIWLSMQKHFWSK